MLVAHGPSGWFRGLFFRLFGGKLGSGCRICFGVEVRGFSKITIGDRTLVGTRSIIDGRGTVTIGSDVNLSSEVMVWSLKHDHADPAFATLAATVRIEDYVWIGPRAIIMPGVTIGQGAVVCGAAVVTRSVSPHTIVAGIPAKEIGQRQSCASYRLDTEYPFL